METLGWVLVLGGFFTALGIALSELADRCRRPRIGRCDRKALDAASEHIGTRDWFVASHIVLH